MSAAPTVEIVRVTGLSNREFLERHARAGCVGLSGGVKLLDFALGRAQRHVDAARAWGVWTHAFVLQGVRADGRHWVVESDLQFHRKHLRLGVQENRLDKYHDEALYANLAILDFGLAPAQVNTLLAEALELVAQRERYSVRELFGTLLALRHPGLRDRPNVLARERSIFCSAFVRRLYLAAGVDLAPGLELKHTTPEHLARAAVPHTRYVLHRQSPHERLAGVRGRLRAGAGASLTRLRNQLAGGRGATATKMDRGR